MATKLLFHTDGSTDWYTHFEKLSGIISEAEYMHTPQPSSFSCQGCGALGVAQGHLCWKGAWWGSWHAGSLLFLDISVDFMDMFIL